MTQDTSPQPSDRGPLRGVRILSLESYLAGNHMTYLLSLYGAEIIKIEAPGAGDPLRGSASGAGHLDNKQQNKKSVALDLKSTSGRELLFRLVEKADVVFSNQKPSALRSFGVSFASLVVANPRIVYTTLSGFGHDDVVPDGPFGGWPAFDIIAQGVAGLQFRCLGPEVDAPGYNGIALGDDGTAVLAALGTVLALRQRDTDGEPQRVDIAMHDAMVYYNGSAVNQWRRQGRSSPRARSSGGSAPYGPYPTADGWVNIAVWGQSLWSRFCAAVGRPEVEHEPRFATPSMRLQNVGELETEVVRPFTLSLSTDEVVAALHKEGIPVAPVYQVGQVAASPQVAARRLFKQYRGPDGEMLETLGSPIKASFLDEEARLGPVPALGEHTATILGEVLGLSESEIDTYRAEGVVAGGCGAP